MRVYLDNCSLQRPLDNQNQTRIEQETEAIIEILAFCEAGSLTLVSSESLLFEINEIRDARRLAACVGILGIAKSHVVTDTLVVKRAAQLEAAGIKPFDALHIASAEAGEADFFGTCDDRLLKKTRTLTDIRVRTVSPIELFEEVKYGYNTRRDG